jgi:hypothetical protein
MISDHVVFSSSHFQVEPDEDEDTNPGIFGKALAAWIAGELRSKGIQVEDVIAEDYGRAVIIHHKPFRLWVACSNVAGEPNRWQMFVATEQSLAGKLFGRRSRGGDLERVRARYRELVPAIPGVSGIEWQQ